ncbi:MAG: c-type cytochrome domain-containing protein [Bacteroidia bacterium]
MKLFLPFGLSLFMIFGAILSTTSCTYDSVCPDNFPCDSTRTITKCDTNLVYFEKDVLPILVSNCARSGCHNEASAQSGVILNNYENVIKTANVEPNDPDRSELYEVLVATDPSERMPPSGPLPANQIQIIKDWIEEGAKNLTCDTTGTGGCDLVDVSYDQFVKPLLTANCVGCHNSSSPSGGIALNTIAAVRSAQANNQFYGSIAHLTGFSRMPQNGAKLDQCEIDKVKSWIDDGMRDN